MDMDASIWSALPCEMVGHVLSFLLLLDVCRNRTVCKEWNQHILSDKFATLHGQHARQHRGPSYIAMSLRHDGACYYFVNGRQRSPTHLEGDQGLWCCFDLSARRWFTFCKDDRIIGASVSGVESMDGGLVCRLRQEHAQPSSEQLSIIVHNVKGSTNVTLPAIARHLNASYDPKLLMVTDSTSFKIFLINHYFKTRIDIEDLDNLLLTSEERLKVKYDPVIHVYDSATCAWKSIGNTSWTERGGLGYITSVVMYQGFLYVLFEKSKCEGYAPSIWKLQRHNVEGESWENVDVRTDRFITASLVVSNDRLFLVLWCSEECSDDDMSMDWSLEVREIRTPDMTHETVLKLSAAVVKANFEIKPWSLFDNSQFNLLAMSVIGFESSLFFMSQASGKSAIFDLVTRSWDHDLPTNPWGPVHKNPLGRCFSAWVGKHMNLLLPWNTDW